MPEDVKITVDKVDSCRANYCWGVFRSDRKDPIIGGLTHEQANKHKKNMGRLLKLTKPNEMQKAIVL